MQHNNSDCLPSRDVKVKDTGLQLQKQWDWICQDTAITDAAKSIQFYCPSPSKPIAVHGKEVYKMDERLCTFLVAPGPKSP